MLVEQQRQQPDVGNDENAPYPDWQDSESLAQHRKAGSGTCQDSSETIEADSNTCQDNSDKIVSGPHTSKYNSIWNYHGNKLRPQLEQTQELQEMDQAQNRNHAYLPYIFCKKI